MALVAPSVSTSVRFLTTAFASASCLAPSDRRPDTNAGMPVGIAEIAIAVPSSSTSLKSSPRATPTTTMNATAPQAMIPSTFVSEPSSRWSGERVRVTEFSIVAICPICVCIPVPVTTIAAVPRVTAVFWNSMFVRSPSATSVPASTLASLGIGALSPVSAASWASSVAACRIRPSAGTRSPASTWTRSPGTRSDRRHERDRAVAHDLGLRHLQVRQRVDAGARAELLPRAEHHVEEDQQRHDHAGRDLADDEAHRR